MFVRSPSQSGMHTPSASWVSFWGWESCHCCCLHFLQSFLSLWDSCVVYLTVTSPASVPAARPHDSLFCLIDASLKDEGLHWLNRGCHLDLMWCSLQINSGFISVFFPLSLAPCDYFFVVLSLPFLRQPLRYCKNETHVLLQSHES